MRLCLTVPLLVFLAACGGTPTPADVASLAATLPSRVGDEALTVSELTVDDLTTFAPDALADAVEADGRVFEDGSAAVAAGVGVNVFAYALPDLDGDAVARDYLSRLGEATPDATYSEPESVLVGDKQVLAVTVRDRQNGQPFTFYTYVTGGTIYLLQILRADDVPVVLAQLP